MSELFAERWTPIIIRNLLAGCTTFGDLVDGAPGISKALLAQRLDLLEEQGILSKEESKVGRGHRYLLTVKGRELKSVIDAMGHWGARWLELQEHHVDASYVLWATCKLIDPGLIPVRGLVVRIELTDQAEKQFWILLRKPYPELCSSYPGGNEDLILRTDSETLARLHLRQISFQIATDSGLMIVEGSQSSLKVFLRCLRSSPYAQN